MRHDYVALDERGRQVTGVLDAPDAGGAAASLRAQGLLPLELRATSGGGGAAGVGLARRELELPSLVWASDIVLFLNQLALMLRSGLALLQSLDTLARVASKAPLRRAARRMAEAVSAGRSLSVALEAEQRLLPPIAVQLVRTAEATGELASAFDRAAEYVERRATLQAQVLQSLIYPAIVVVAALVTFLFLTTQVIPKFEAFLARRRGALPWSTQKLMSVSAFVQDWWPTGLGLTAGAVLLVVLARRTERGRSLIDRAVLSIPVIGGLLRAGAHAHLSRTLGLLLASGLPLVESLRILGESFSNRCWVELIARARERVVQGTPLAASLSHPVVSPLLTQVVGVGEQTGALDDVLAEVGRFFDRRLQAHIRTLSLMVEPAVILLVGGMVGFVYISFFQALFSLAGGR